MMADYGPLIEMLRERLGLDPESLGPKVLQQMIDECCRERSLAGPGELHRRALVDRAEWLALVDFVVVPETWWFRVPDQFEDAVRWLRELPQGSAPLRLLSMPCATGEEAYSLAAAMLDGGFRPGSFSVVGVDVSPRAIQAAVSARYTRNSLRGRVMDPQWFDDHGDVFSPNSVLRGCVQFQVGNALDPCLFTLDTRFELIFCRNLIIYLDAEARTQLLRRLAHWLAPNGMLCTGQAEILPLGVAEWQPAPSYGPLSYLRRPHSAHHADLFDAASLMAAPIPRQRPTTEHAPVGGQTRAQETLGRPGRMAQRDAAERSTVAESVPVKADSERPRAESLALDEIRRAADLGKLDWAQDACIRRLAQRSECVETWLLLGMIELGRGALDAADHALGRVCYLNPEHAEAIRCRAALAERQGRVREARQFQAQLRRLSGADCRGLAP